MRLNKFRAWDKTLKIMSDWDSVSERPMYVLNADVINNVFMQFTGLLDKNGIDIYEGDLIELLRNEYACFEVIFVNDYVGGWVLKCGNHEAISLGARDSTTIEVIGNIYENPELLNQEN